MRAEALEGMKRCRAFGSHAAVSARASDASEVAGGKGNGFAPSRRVGHRGSLADIQAAAAAAAAAAATTTTTS